MPRKSPPHAGSHPGPIDYGLPKPPPAARSAVDPDPVTTGVEPSKGEMTKGGDLFTLRHFAKFAAVVTAPIWYPLYIIEGFVFQ
jgi:hypothetical protein